MKLYKHIYQHKTGPFKGLWGRNDWSSRCAWRDYFLTRSQARDPWTGTPLVMGEYLHSPQSHEVRYELICTDMTGYRSKYTRDTLSEVMNLASSTIMQSTIYKITTERML